MGISTKKWDDLPYPGLVFSHTSSQEVFHMESLTDKVQEFFLRNKRRANIMRVVDTILSAASEAVIYENLCIIDNKSTCNAFINGKYLSDTSDAPYGQYLRDHFNTGVTYTNKIGDIPGY